MRVCDVKGCGKPAKETVVDVNVATPHEDDISASEVSGTRYLMDLCDGHLDVLQAFIADFEPGGGE